MKREACGRWPRKILDYRSAGKFRRCIAFIVILLHRRIIPFASILAEECLNQVRPRGFETRRNSVTPGIFANLPWS
jgi:hypothetical protein